MSSRDGGPRVFRAALWAQRQAAILPAPVRRAGRLVLHRFSGDRTQSGPSEDWSVPLLPRHGNANVEELLPVATDAPRPDATTFPVAPVAAGLPVVRCVVATGVLDVGGGEQVCALLARRLPEFGVGTTVVYADTRLTGEGDRAGWLAQQLTEAGVTLVRLSPETAAQWLREHRPDVVSAHYAPEWMLDAAVEAGVAWVETLHGLNSLLSAPSWGEERIRSRKFTAIVSVSEMLRRQYLNGNPDFAADRIAVIPNGAETDRYQPVDRDEARAALGLGEEFLFLSLARYCLQKNNFGLVDAFADVAARHPEAHLLLAGRADDQLYFAQIEQHARSLPCADRIHLRGHCRNAPALLSAADAFVLDSFFEGSPLSTMEALASGLPTIVSDVSGVRETLAGTEHGKLVGNPGGAPEGVDWEVIGRRRFGGQHNREELVAAMSAVVDDQARWRAERRKLREASAALFPLDRNVARHAAVLRAVAAGDPLPPD